MALCLWVVDCPTQLIRIWISIQIKKKLQGNLLACECEWHKSNSNKGTYYLLLKKVLFNKGRTVTCGKMFLMKLFFCEHFVLLKWKMIERKRKWCFHIVSLYGTYLYIFCGHYFIFKVQNDSWPKEIENVLGGVANMHLLPPSF